MTHWLRAIWSRACAVLRKERLDSEFDEELTTHLELLIEEGRRSGLSESEARREALRKLGHVESVREQHRDQRGLPLLEVLAQDLRYAIRTLWKTRAFTCITTLSLALGIGANTALFSIVDDLLLRSLPVSAPDRLVQLEVRVMAFGTTKVGTSFPPVAFDYVRTHNHVFSEVVGFGQLDRPVVSIGGVAEPGSQVEHVSDSFFRDLGVTPILGRLPEASDSLAAIVSHRLWRTRFGADSSILGRSVVVDGQAFTILGVAPPQFLGLSLESSADLWITSRRAPQQMIARLKPDVTPMQAQAALETLVLRISQEVPGVFPKLPPQATVRVSLLPAGKGLSQLRSQYERPLLALTVLVAVVLLITCSNLGNLLVVRNTARRREMTVRVALGARRSRLLLQYIIESVVLAALGGVFALVFARWGVSIILSMLPLPEFPEGLAFHADARVLAFTAGISLLSALLFGLAPAWRATVIDLTADLRLSHGSTQGQSARRLGRILVACQVSLSVLLLVGAGLFVRTLRNLVGFDVGFNPEGLLQVSLDSPGAGYRRGDVGRLHQLLLERVSAMPGVLSVAAIRNSVMQGHFSRGRFDIPGRTFDHNEAWDVAEVGPSFFETMGIPVLRGRGFTAADAAQGRSPVVVSESFARKYFPNENPVGKRVGDLSIEIVGVVEDAKLTDIRRPGEPMAYSLTPREPDRISALQVRVSGNPAAVAGVIRSELQRIHPRLLMDIRPMRQEIDRSIAKERMVAATSAFFSLLGLLLASIGIFGVASYTVVQRTNELGIRMALGAGRWQVIRESLRDIMHVFSIGLAVGTILAIAVVRLAASVLSELLFGLTATDAATIAGAAILMVVVAVAACILPARRATRIDPLAAIRYE